METLLLWIDLIFKSTKGWRKALVRHLQDDPYPQKPYTKKEKAVGLALRQKSMNRLVSATAVLTQSAIGATSSWWTSANGKRASSGDILQRVS